MASRKAGVSNEKATIFDVAKLAGVSIKTVSRVVNNEPNVRSKTRQAVMNAVERLHYRPNAAARGLSGKRSYTIGLVYENPHEFSYVGAVLNGALAACEAEGYSLLLRPLTLPDSAVAVRVRQFAQQAAVDGILLPAPLGDIEEVMRVVHELKLPHATISPRCADEDAIKVYCEDEHASFELTEYLVQRGHRVIGFIKGHPDHDASAKRLSGYRRALKEHGIRFDSKLVRQGYFDFVSGRACAASLLDGDRTPSVIIASNDDMAAGVMVEAHERGVAIPEELAVVGFDDSPLASQMWPPLTTVRQPVAEMAESATRLLIARTRGEQVSSMPSERFKCELVIRSSA